MGRPINKKYLGAESGNQIQAIAKLPGQAEGTGYIVSQRGTKKFRVSIDGTEGVCKLVNKDAGTLADGEMIINVVDDAGNTVQVTKLHNRMVVVEGNQKTKWNFNASVTDGAVQMTDPASINITQQPVDAETNAGAASFNVVVEIDGTSPIVPTYQWQVKIGNAAYADIADGVAGNLTYAGATSDTLGISGTTANEDGYKYRVVVSGTGVDSKTSKGAKLIFVS